MARRFVDESATTVAVQAAADRFEEPAAVALAIARRLWMDQHPVAASMFTSATVEAKVFPS